VWLRRPEPLYAEDLTAEDALKRVESRARRLSRTIIASAKILLFVLFLGSVALALTGFSVNLNGPLPVIGILLTALTLIPALLQTLDWLWPNAPIGKYRLAFKWLSIKLAKFIQQRAITRTVARYGSQEIARRIFPEDEAARFTISSYLRRRRRNQRIILTVGALILIGGGVSAVAEVEHSTPDYKVGQPVVLDNGFSVEAIEGLNCTSVGATESGPLCDIKVQFRNIGHFAYLLGPGSFTSAGPGEIQSPGEYSYAVALISHGNYYDFYNASFSGTPDEVQPGQTVMIVLSFQVSEGVYPDELLVESEANGSSIKINLA
jgi:hypothetical protein